IHCIANDHRRTRNAQAAAPGKVAFLIGKFMVVPLFATAFFGALKAIGLGEGIIPSIGMVYQDACFASVVMWAAWGTFDEFVLHRAQVKKLLADPMHVRRDMLEEAKFKHTFGMESWLAFWMVITVACLGAVIGLS
ncbi:MAG: hypothetical protein V4760_02950, partial [Bdellovibrionota bacterium]